MCLHHTLQCARMRWGLACRHRVFSAQKVQMLRGIAGEHNMSDIPEVCLHAVLVFELSCFQLDAHRRLEMARGHIHQGRHEREAALTCMILEYPNL